MKYIIIFLMFLLTLTSCNKEVKKTIVNEAVEIKPVVSKEKLIVKTDIFKESQPKTKILEIKTNKKISKKQESTSVQTIKKTEVVKKEKIKEEPTTKFLKVEKEVLKSESKKNIEKTLTEPIKRTVKEKVKIVIKSLSPELIRLNTAEFKEKIYDKKVQLIDVRTPKEYKENHIPKANNINIYDVNFVQQALTLDKSKPVYVYCKSGVRSMKAAKKLKAAGFKVYNLNNGIKGWKKSGNKTEK